VRFITAARFGVSIGVGRGVFLCRTPPRLREGYPEETAMTPTRCLVSAVSLSALMATGCGHPGDALGGDDNRDGPGGLPADDPDYVAPDPDGGDSGDPTGEGRFTLEVVGGFGSGVYPAGATVHVWSAASTKDEVVLPWGGDASLLHEPAESHSTFVMPARDVRLVSNTAPQPLALTVETFTGSTTRPKTVRYHFPPAMRGVVLFSHGTGGSNTFIIGAEAFTLARALVHAGYGVIGTEAEEAVAGDLNGDGKERWSAGSNFRADNVDLLNLEALFASLEARGVLAADTPKFALGMSAGGAFSHFLGTVAASPVADRFPRLRFEAVVSYCADTGPRPATLSTTPSAWFMCGAEDHPEVSNTEARANSERLAARGIPTLYVEHPATPLYDERFSRIEGIPLATSSAMAAELRAAGFVDAGGFLTEDGDAIGQLILANPSRFPTIVDQTESPGAIRAQLKAMRAEHSMYADFAQKNIAWFDRFGSTP
jgi:hypothetical protein